MLEPIDFLFLGLYFLFVLVLFKSDDIIYWFWEKNIKKQKGEIKEFAWEKAQDGSWNFISPDFFCNLTLQDHFQIVFSSEIQKSTKTLMKARVCLACEKSKKKLHFMALAHFVEDQKFWTIVSDLKDATVVQFCEDLKKSTYFLIELPDIDNEKVQEKGYQAHMKLLTTKGLKEEHV
jgi:hypothetical protein